MARHKLESNQEIAVDDVIDEILRLKKFHGTPVIYTPQALVLRNSISMYYQLFQTVNLLHVRANTPFDKLNLIHERKLELLWTLYKPDVPYQRITKNWTSIGFQGSDPSTDFRGMGLLGLDDLIYFMKNHKEKATRVLNTSTRPAAWFSMAI
ncbi:hypothetical protein HK096_001794, partial [Nowakowskiella sp. JEL0078]